MPWLLWAWAAATDVATVTTSAPTSAATSAPNSAPSSTPSVGAPAACRTSACWRDAFAVRPLSVDEATAMRGTVWRPGCPVGLDELREVHVAHATSPTSVATGVLVVHAAVADDVVAAFRELLDAGFVIERVAPATVAGGDDLRLMEANITSAFNCRAVTGGTAFSPHSWGVAIDINPRWNPWVVGSKVLPPSGRPWASSREPGTPGLLLEGSPAVVAFEGRGWTWGGRWRRPVDWQHVEKRSAKRAASPRAPAPPTPSPLSTAPPAKRRPRRGRPRRPRRPVRPRRPPRS